MLSDMAIATSSHVISTAPPLFPTNSHSLSTAHYLMKILGELQECISELNGLEIASEVSSSLKGLLESTRWKFMEILVDAWLRGESP